MSLPQTSLSGSGLPGRALRAALSGPVRAIFAFALLEGAAMAAPASTIRFNRDIRPILSDNCFKCHGPDRNARKADLRLDVRQEALREHDGVHAIAPGQPARSALLTRILQADPQERMPPPETGKTLAPGQVEVLKRWIEEGAEYEGHWAFLPLERPAVPSVKSAQAPPNPIDSFIRARLEAEGLAPAPPAEPRVLARRLHEDLLGLPAPPGVVEALEADASAAAYEALVDDLLASPRFGERMAVHWLDLVRYGDSVGYHGDQELSMSPYRDYVIRAFNEDKPYDVFTIEQLAGDLLPNATLEQRVASGYNRLNQMTTEGGAQDKEYRLKYAADRVRTTSTIWMGATLGCAECHDHKFDPYTTRDFYSFSAFFADLDERGYYPQGWPQGDWGPRVSVPSPEQSNALAALEDEIGSLERRLAEDTPALDAAQGRWEEEVAREALIEASPWEVIGPFAAESLNAAHDGVYPPEEKVDLAAAYNGGSLRWVARPEWKDGEVHNTLQGESSATYLHRTLKSDAAQSIKVSLGSDDALKVWLNGKLLLAKLVSRAAAADQESLDLALEPGINHLLLKVSNGTGGYGFYAKLGSAQPEDLARAARTPTAERDDAARKLLRERFRAVTPLLAAQRDALSARTKERDELTRAFPTSLVSVSVEPRAVRILPRGNWLDESGPVVEPAVPAFLGSVQGGGRATRLDLARWLVSRQNPLAARAFVNRLWALLFGAGLSRVLDDIGAQGEWPRHPELLDWLAAELVESGWDIKHLLRLTVSSETYRRSSDETSALREKDPRNRLFGRQSRLRLPAEMVRDAVLSVSGLLVQGLGGPSVKPYQPGGYWDQLNFPARGYDASPGADQYRRGVYTHWQRTFLHPSLLAFDAAARQECTAERGRSNTPLQALVLLNDPTFVEAARALAERMLRCGRQDAGGRIAFAFREALARRPEPREAAVLEALLSDSLEEHRASPEAAAQLLKVGLHPVPADLDGTELAAWTTVARAILNLSELITRD